MAMTTSPLKLFFACAVLVLLWATAALSRPQTIPPSSPQNGSPRSSSNPALLREAAKAFAARDFKLAEVELQTILQADPEDFRALNFMGILRAEQKRESEAEDFFKRVIRIKPDFAGGHAGLGLLYMQMGKRDDAIAQLGETLRLDSSRTDVRDSLVRLRIEEASAALGEKNPEKALAALLQARKLNPSDLDVQYRLGMVELQMSLFADAKEAFYTVLGSKPDDGPALYGLGRAQMGAAKYADAKESFSRYVQLHADDPSGYYALGLALQTLQENQAAREQFQRSITLRPAQTESYFRLGLLDLAENQLDGAEKNFRTTLKRDEKHAGALTGMGQIEYQRKSYDGATEFLRRAIANDSSIREAHYYLGLTLARLNQKEESAKELEIATQLEHAEVEQHQHALKILGLDEGSESAAAPAN
jgi:tetratricopeptide (TPR) repeat protein